MTLLATGPVIGGGACERREPANARTDTGDDDLAPVVLSTHRSAAIAEFHVAEEGDRTPPHDAEWADLVNPWYRFDFEDAEMDLNQGRLVALPCRPEDRAAAEVAITCEIQSAVQTHYDAQAGLLWLRHTKHATAPASATARRGTKQ